MKEIKIIWKCLKFILCTTLFILYVLITLNARNRYLAGESRGYQCTDVTGNGFTDTYTYDRNQEPTREYLTWKEFRQRLNF